MTHATRRSFTLALAATAVALLLVLPAPSSAKVSHDFLGVVAEDVLVGDDAYREAQLAAQQQLGVGLIRQTFRWDEIELTPGYYDFSVYDRLVAAAARHRIKIMPIVFAPPAFRSGAPAGYSDRFTYPPRSNDEMGAFTAVLVKRYGPGGSFWASHPETPYLPIHSWQIWNEPNLKYYWPGGPDPRAYTAMLWAASAAIRSVDPGAEIVTAGMPDSNKGTPLLKFVQGMYKAGARKAFNTLAVNLYGTPDQMLERTKLVRQLMDQQHHSKGRIRVTEIGWATAGPKGKYTVGMKEQARRVQTVLKGFAKQRGKLGVSGIVYFNWKDLPSYPGRTDFWGLHTGLLDASGKPKPALAALAKVLRAL